MSSNCDVVVIGAGAVGAACAYYLTELGLAVKVIDRGSVAGGTTGAGEGNILVSDKPPGPELELALRSIGLWHELGESLGPSIELEPKGGVVVAGTRDGLQALKQMADRQHSAGVTIAHCAQADLRELEPELTESVCGGVLYPQDMQVQPMRAAAQLLKVAKSRGAELRLGEAVTGIEQAGGRVVAVRTAAGRIASTAVVNATGTWASATAALAGVDVPIKPRRGFILVTEPVRQIVRHKVYGADYVANVQSEDEALETSAVVESTASGTILIGASRERVGFDRSMSVPVLARLAAQAVALFPALANVRAMRAYRGFRPYSPDHLPVIGADERVPGLFHACGHEGAGIGLAPITGKLIAQAVAGVDVDVDVKPFGPARFEGLKS